MARLAKAMRVIAMLFSLFVVLTSSANAAAIISCESLMSVALDHATITAATVVTAGSFPARDVDVGPTPVAVFASLPPFCRVQGVITPSADSDIQFEVWLPVSGWNGKYEGVGNGGFAGYVNYADMAVALRAGYATSSTDTGHRGTNAQWGLRHPEKVVDFGYRAIHETALKSKTIVEAFYQRRPVHSYFSSCSNGGRQALMEAQRFPEDFDGIIAGAPAANITRVAQLYVSNAVATTIDPDSYIPATKFAAVEAAALAGCDARDGVRDGIIGEPQKCMFDPRVLQCTGPEADSCLTAKQVAALKKIYGGLRTSGGEQLYPGFLPGGETGPRGWATWIAGPAPTKGSQYFMGTQGNANLIFQNAAYDYRQFNADRDVKAADDLAGRVLNAVDADLHAFQQRGGKLVIYHGWSDAAIPPTATINYYTEVTRTMGRKTADGFVRLYMIPGMQHCGGGPGPDSFGVALPSGAFGSQATDPRRDLGAALQQWVEHGVAPNAVVSTKYKTASDPASGVAFTRPICPYPQVAKYKGSGSNRQAENFVCKSSDK